MKYPALVRSRSHGLDMPSKHAGHAAIIWESGPLSESGRRIVRSRVLGRGGESARAWS
jgi:hypothetical protein